VAWHASSAAGAWSQTLCKVQSQAAPAMSGFKTLHSNAKVHKRIKQANEPAGSQQKLVKRQRQSTRNAPAVNTTTQMAGGFLRTNL
jgi:hypothetical protein